MFDFGPIFKYHTKEWKKSIEFPDAELCAESFEKKTY